MLLFFALLVGLLSVGEAQQFSSGRCPTGPIDLVIIVDASESMEDIYADQISILLDMLGILDISPTQTNVALIDYNSVARKVFGFSGIQQTQREVQKRLGQLRPLGGGTATAFAVDVASRELTLNGRKGGRRAVILLNDGVSQDRSKDTVDASVRLHNTGATVFTVTMHPKPNTTELKLYTGNDRRIYRRQDQRRFLDDFQRFKNGDDCDQTTTKWPTVKTTTTPYIVTTTRRPYTTPTTSWPYTTPTTSWQGGGNGDCNIDLMIVLDTSGSVKRVFREQRTFAVRLARSLPAGVRLALAMVRYSHAPSLEIPFSARVNRETLARRIAAVSWTGGSTHTAAAADVAIAELQRHGRQSAKKLAVLIGDGNSQDHWQRVKSTARRLNIVADSVFMVTMSSDYYMPELLEYANGKDHRVYTKARIHKFDSDFQTEVDLCGGGGIKTTTIDFSGDCEDDLHPELLFVIDTSGSTEHDFSAHRQLALDLVKSTPPAFNIGALQFSDRPTTVLSFGRHGFGEAEKALRGLRFTGGSTRLAAACSQAADVLRSNKRSAQQVVILLSDGKSEDTWPEIQAASRKLQATGAEVYAAALGRLTAPMELQQYTGSAQRVFNGAARTADFKRQILSRLRQPTNTKCPTTPYA